MAQVTLVFHLLSNNSKAEARANLEYELAICPTTIDEHSFFYRLSWIPNATAVVNLLRESTTDGGWYRRHLDVSNCEDPEKKVQGLITAICMLIRFAGGNTKTKYHEEHYWYRGQRGQIIWEQDQIWQVTIKC